MLEVLYEKATHRVKAWCGDSAQFGNYKPKEGQTVIILPVEVKDIPHGEDYMIDLDDETVYPKTPHVKPPDYKAQWKVATNQGQKLDIIAKILKLEDE